MVTPSALPVTPSSRSVRTDFVNLLAAPSIQERLRVFGFTSEAGAPDDLSKTMREDMARNGELNKRTGASAQ